jgi:hypothetical protein
MLTEVAAGRLSPEEAARRLDAGAGDDATTEAGAGTQGDGDGDGGGEPGAGAGTAGREPQRAVRRIRVQSSARPVRLYADAAVDTLVVDGPHEVHREGETLRVVAPPGNQAAGDGSYRYETRSAWSRWIQQAQLLGVPLTVRVNPALAVDVEVMAGSLDVAGLRGPLGVEVTAGSLRVDDCTGPLQGQVRAGSAKIEARPTAGASHLRVESGSVVLRLLRGSDVRVRARAELGEVKLDGSGKSAKMSGDGYHERVVGAGTATFDLEVVMGSAKVTTP